MKEKHVQKLNSSVSLVYPDLPNISADVSHIKSVSYVPSDSILSEGRSLPIITVNTTKLNIAPYIFERYNKEPSVNMLPGQLPESLLNRQRSLKDFIENSVDMQSTSEIKANVGVFLGRSIPLKEIIEPGVKKRLKREIKKSQSVQNLIIKTQVSKLSPLERINETLDRQMDASHLSLIKYLNSKQNVSPQFVESIGNSNMSRLTRLDKICQKEGIKANVSQIYRIRQTKEEAIKEAMGRMLESVLFKQRRCAEIVNEYNKEQSRFHDKVFQEYGDIRRQFWDRYNIEHVSRKLRRSVRVVKD